MFTLKICLDPSNKDLAVINGGLNAFNAGVGISSQKDPIAIFIRDEHGDIQGGVYGNIAWSWLHIRWVWLDTPFRSRGLAGKMLDMAEDHARTHGCIGAYIDTFSASALRVYERQGYKKFGELQDFPPGRTRTFLQKKL